jgi:hypothetical protein
VDAVTDEDLDAIVAGLVRKAREGDLAAAKLVLGYAVGRPAAAVNPDTLDQEEYRHFQREAEMFAALPGILRALPPDVLVAFVHAFRPIVSEEIVARFTESLREAPLPGDAEAPAGESDPSANGDDGGAAQEMPGHAPAGGSAGAPTTNGNNGGTAGRETHARRPGPMPAGGAAPDREVKTGRTTPAAPPGRVPPAPRKPNGRTSSRRPHGRGPTGPPGLEAG